jgi:hypothetical protein
LLTRDEAFPIAVNIAKLLSVPRQILKDTPRPPNSAWLDLYVNREKEIGLSVLQAVTPKDEWCAEAYMETDYSTITQNNFEEIVKNYAVFRLLGASGMPNLMVDHDDS